MFDHGRREAFFGDPELAPRDGEAPLFGQFEHACGIARDHFADFGVLDSGIADQPVFQVRIFAAGLMTNAPMLARDMVDDEIDGALPQSSGASTLP